MILVTLGTQDKAFVRLLQNIDKEIINGNIHNYENEYNNMMKEYIKTPFIEEYNSILNESTEDMKNFIGKEKIELKEDSNISKLLECSEFLSNRIFYHISKMISSLF